MAHLNIVERFGIVNIEDLCAESGEGKGEGWAFNKAVCVQSGSYLYVARAVSGLIVSLW